MSQSESMEKFCLDTQIMNDVITNLQYQYDKNITATLNEENENLLYSIADKLQLLFQTKNISLDKDKFINLIKKLYPGDQMIGGDDEIVTASPSVKQPGINRYDFLAVLAFIVSIYLLYLSYIQLNDLACNLTGSSVVQLSNEFKDQIVKAINNLPREQMPFLTYMYKIFSSFSTDIISSQTTAVSDIIKKNVYTFLNEAIVDFSSTIKAECITKETGWTGYLEATAKTYFSSQATTNCMTKLNSNLIKMYMLKATNDIDLLFINIDTKKAQIKDLVYYGCSLGYYSIAYISYRIYNLKNSRIKSTNSIPMTNVEGGTRKKRKRSKKTKKQKNKKTKKNISKKRRINLNKKK
jgi:hypothetical protein